MTAYETRLANTLRLTPNMRGVLFKLHSYGYASAGTQTWRALTARGLITGNTAPRTSTHGVRCLYMLTTTGAETAQELVDAAAQEASGWRTYLSHPESRTEYQEATTYGWIWARVLVDGEQVVKPDTNKPRVHAQYLARVETAVGKD